MLEIYKSLGKVVIYLLFNVIVQTSSKITDTKLNQGDTQYEQKRYYIL